MAETTDVEFTGEFCFVYSTYPDRDAALTAARLAVDEKLAACVNLNTPMTSVYMWEGRREEAAEIAAFFKTRRSLAEKLIAALWNIHPYSIPCFVIQNIEGGNQDYLAWVRSQTEQPVTI